jgi:hypothetical protein
VCVCVCMCVCACEFCVFGRRGVKVARCTWGVADESCRSHDLDSVVFCYHGAGLQGEGGLRLIAGDGAPSMDGSGRLEIYKSGRWAPVCTEGFSDGGVSVACRQMGYAGASVQGVQRCVSIKGENYCADVAPHISEVSCSGDEAYMLSCTYSEGDEVFCAPNEAAVISCSGDGDAQGRAPKAPSPSA